MEQLLSIFDRFPLYVRGKYIGEVYNIAFKAKHYSKEEALYDISMDLCYIGYCDLFNNNYFGGIDDLKYMAIDKDGIYFMHSLSKWYLKEIYVIEYLSIQKHGSLTTDTLHIRARVLKLEKVYADDLVYKPLPGNVTVKERDPMKNGITIGKKVGYAIFDECGVYDELVKYMPRVKKIIFSEPATIVLWGDGSKTVVKCNVKSEPYDKEKGLAMCIAERYFGNYTKFKKAMKEAEEDAE